VVPPLSTSPTGETLSLHVRIPIAPTTTRSPRYTRRRWCRPQQRTPPKSLSIAPCVPKTATETPQHSGNTTPFTTWPSAIWSMEGFQSTPRTCERLYILAFTRSAFWESMRRIHVLTEKATICPTVTLPNLTRTRLKCLSSLQVLREGRGGCHRFVRCLWRL
jgi:hypothetical protein